MPTYPRSLCAVGGEVGLRVLEDVPFSAFGVDQ